MDNGFNYASAGIKIYLRRKSLGLLFGSFYAPTATFAMLSMLSYCINPDMVIKNFKNCQFIYNYRLYFST